MPIPYAFLTAEKSPNGEPAVATRRTLSVESVQDLGRLIPRRFLKSSPRHNRLFATPMNCTTCCFGRILLPVDEGLIGGFFPNWSVTVERP